MNETTISLNFCFYLVLLINHKKDYINYIYSFDYIRQIYLVAIDKKQKLFRKLILNKIIFELINNYKGMENCKEEDELNEMLKHCNEKVENILIHLKNIGLQFDLSDIKSKRIDEIYNEIIIYLIQYDKFESEDYALNIIKQLDLESIKITNIMFDNLKIFFNKKEADLKKKYGISSKNDLSDKTKINFYYFLFRYILKNPLYIYQIPFLLKNRKNIKSMIKQSNISPENEKVDFILIKF